MIKSCIQYAIRVVYHMKLPTFILDQYLSHNFPAPTPPSLPFSGLSSHGKTINVSPHMMHCYETLTHQKYYSIFH